MTTSEQATIKALAESLRDSSNTEWTTGEFRQWTNYAKTMRDTIRTVVPVLRELAKTPPEDSKPDPLDLN